RVRRINAGVGNGGGRAGRGRSVVDAADEDLHRLGRRVEIDAGSRAAIAGGNRAGAAVVLNLELEAGQRRAVEVRIGMELEVVAVDGAEGDEIAGIHRSAGVQGGARVERPAGGQV